MDASTMLDKMAPTPNYRLGPSPHFNSDYQPQGNHLYENEYTTSLHPALPTSPVEGTEKENPAEYPGSSEANNSQEFLCNICGKQFIILARLQRHLRVHTGEKPFRCEFCDKTFSVKENLNVHRRIHTKVRPYLCSICDRAFEHSGKLHRHMRTHTGERPHRCELCGKTFVQSGQLVIHMRAHTGEKPYVCEYCPKGFTCSKQLKVHLRTHTGEKPYACDVCGKTFGYNHVLKMHKVSHLGKKLYKCTLCDQFFSSRKALDKHIKDHQENPHDSKQSVESVRASTVIQGNVAEKRKSPQTFSPLSIPASYPIAPQPSSPHAPSHTETEPHFSREYENGAFTETNIRSKVPPPQYSPEAGKCRGVNSVCGPLTPPESPDSIEGISVPQDASQFQPRSTEHCWTSVHGPFHPRTPEMAYKDRPYRQDELPSFQHQQPELAFFTTITGDRIACPVDRVIRLSGPSSSQEKEQFPFHSFHKSLLQENLQETLKIRVELQNRLKQEEYQRQRETAFFDSVLKVLESCIGTDRLHRLGYPKLSLDDIIINTLKAMGTQACSEPSLSSMDRIKVNLRLLLECCIPDPELWAKFGWIGKSIEDIVAEFLKNNNATKDENSTSG